MTNCSFNCPVIGWDKILNMLFSTQMNRVKNAEAIFSEDNINFIFFIFYPLKIYFLKNQKRSLQRNCKHCKSVHLKGVCHEIFDLHLFHDSNPYRPLMSRLKYFRIRFQFRDIRIFKKFCGVQCASYCGVKLRSVHHTAVSIFMYTHI